MKTNDFEIQNQVDSDLFPSLFPKVFCGICGTSHQLPLCKFISLDNTPYLPARTKIYYSDFLLQTHNPNVRGYGSTHPDTKRGSISTFSQKSGRNLKLKIANLDIKYYKTKFFCTYTFRYVYPEDYFSLHHFLLLLLKRIERIIPDGLLIWRIEFQKRGAPHFHILFFLPHSYNCWKKRILGSNLKKCWGQVTQQINDCSYSRGSEIIECNESSKLLFYLSKYCAKESDYKPTYNIGRYWGIRGNQVLKEKKFLECSEKFELLLRKNILKYYSSRFDVADEFSYYILQSKDTAFVLQPEAIIKILYDTEEQCGESIFDIAVNDS